MQSEGLILFLFIIVSVPIMIVTSNHNIFFVIVGLAIAFVSIINIRSIFQLKQVDEEPEDAEEIEGMINIDSHKFGRGIEFVKGLTIILLFIYCSVYVKAHAFKVLIALAIAFRAFDISVYLKSNQKAIDHFNSIWAVRTITLFVNLVNIAIILPVAYNKFIHPIF